MIRTIRLALTYDDVLLVPKRSSLRSRKDVDTSTFLTREIELKIPVVSANMDTVTEVQMAVSMATLGGIGFIHRFLTVNEQANQIAKVKKAKVSDKNLRATVGKNGKLAVGAAVGVKPDALDRAKAAISAGCDALVLDIAHAHADSALEILAKLKKNFPKIPVVAGNVATAEGTRDLIKAGADCIKVGIGPGSMCTTRIIAGAGIPQLTAVMDCSKVARPLKIPIIADGGIRIPSDLSKAIGAGASTVMIGGLFAGTTESPGMTVNRQGKKYKISRGMASVGANTERMEMEELHEYVAEGVEAFVPFRGEVEEVVSHLIGGLRSGMSYSGARNIREFWKKAEFIRITPAGRQESLPHDVELM